MSKPLGSRVTPWIAALLLAVLLVPVTQLALEGDLDPWSEIFGSMLFALAAVIVQVRRRVPVRPHVIVIAALAGAVVAPLAVLFVAATQIESS